MGEAMTLSISTKKERTPFTIDGNQFHLINKDELSLVARANLKGYTDLIEGVEGDPEKAKIGSEALCSCIKLIVPDIDDSVLDKVSDLDKIGILTFFNEVSGVKAPQPLPPKEHAKS